MTRIEINIDQRPAAQLTDQELDEEIMLLHTAVTELGQRHTQLMREWDNRKTQKKVDDVMKEMIGKRTPKVKRRL